MRQMPVWEALCCGAIFLIIFCSLVSWVIKDWLLLSYFSHLFLRSEFSWDMSSILEQNKTRLQKIKRGERPKKKWNEVPILKWREETKRKWVWQKEGRENEQTEKNKKFEYKLKFRNNISKSRRQESLHQLQHHKSVVSCQRIASDKLLARACQMPLS